MTAPYAGSMVERIFLASLAGLRPQAIAALVGRTECYVGVVLHKLRRRGVLPATVLCSAPAIVDRTPAQIPHGDFLPVATRGQPGPASASSGAGPFSRVRA